MLAVDRRGSEPRVVDLGDVLGPAGREDPDGRVVAGTGRRDESADPLELARRPSRPAPTPRAARRRHAP